MSDSEDLSIYQARRNGENSGGGGGGELEHLQYLA